MADGKFKDVKFDPKINKIYCYRCKRWFFSRVFMEHHRHPLQCPLCKRYDWMKPNLGGKKLEGV